MCFKVKSIPIMKLHKLRDELENQVKEDIKEDKAIRIQEYKATENKNAI